MWVDRPVCAVHGCASSRDLFWPLQHHLQLADLLQQLRFLGLTVFIVLGLHASVEELPGATQQLRPLLAELDRIAPRVVVP